jgi:hypothetical protein
MSYEVVQSRDSPDEWRVERIDHEGDGEIEVTIFSGRDAAVRAKEYADWKNARSHRHALGVVQGRKL